ncbi:Por secretion system C-terminal sorting domain-containing protein [Polaribacter sp. KT25b]|uniref:T9SS type A sorting domain-containing protein n=1 Tax=Polaribacter sp. KT25b TaxID=1855336 RepID=UPI00087D7E7A|nr:T9SS type A sorting domain-containing protein [Polaribacter sp. KT25b]SDR74336.1 Por secretion system C-terminal sorting domain-containing protein [Polaribacter sp. KT25b]
MKIKTPYLFLLIFLNSFLIQSQITEFKEKFEIPAVAKETSGLLFLNGKIITHNDSGDNAYLYELDSLTGVLNRRITITNATNVDWEDLADDETYIYISDSGNNKGTRTDLKIYRVLKSDLKKSNTVSAETISFSYEDQTSFDGSDTHNFDAEALVVYENNFLIFTKNRGDLKTNVYKFPITLGNHTAVKVSSANIVGLITGATVQNSNFLLCGINANAIPFLVHISANRSPGDDIFKSGFSKYTLTNELGVGNQVEGITSFDYGRFYISREAVNEDIISLKQKLFEFRDYRSLLLSIEKNTLENLNIYPNPTSGNITIRSEKEIQTISIYNTLGKKIKEFNANQKEINISNFSKGIYLLKIKFDDKKNVIRKIIKH